MEHCPKCNSLLRIGTTSYSFENDDTPDKETIAYLNMPRLCPNRECDHYAGDDFSNPLNVVETIRHRVN